MAMTDIFLKDSFKQLERLIKAYKTPILLALAPEMQDIKYINSAFYAAHKEVKKLKSQMRFERGHTDYERQLENFEYDFLDCIGEKKRKLNLLNRQMKSTRLAWTNSSKTKHTAWPA